MSKHQCRAKTSYFAEEDAELSFLAGEMITIINRDDPAWWVGELNGKQGSFPATAVEFVGAGPLTKKGDLPPGTGGGEKGPVASAKPLGGSKTASSTGSNAPGSASSGSSGNTHTSGATKTPDTTPKPAVSTTTSAPKATTEPTKMPTSPPIHEKKASVNLMLGAAVAPVQPVVGASGQYELPPPSHLGPNIADDTKTSEQLKQVDRSKENKSTGSLALSLAQKGDTEITQFPEKYGNIDHLICAEFDVINSASSDVTVVSLKAEYLHGDKGWTEAENVSQGQRDSQPYTYKWVSSNKDKKDRHEITFAAGARFLLPVPDTDADLALGLGDDDGGNSTRPSESKDKVGKRIMLGALIKLKALQFHTGEQQRRVHSKLPNPLHVRFTLSDAKGESTNIVVAAINPPLYPELITKEKIEAKHGGANRTCFGYLQCDDAAADGRIAVSGWYQNEGTDKQWEVWASFNANYHATFKESDLAKLAEDASNENKSEWPVEKANILHTARAGGTNPTGRSLSTSVFVDVKKRKLYAFKFTLKTNSGMASQAFLIPY